MHEFKRPQFLTLINRLKENPQHLNFVLGPRQVGKTTLVVQVLKELTVPSLFVSVDEPDSVGTTSISDLENLLPDWDSIPSYIHNQPRDESWIVRKWKEARSLSRKSEKGFVLAIDEIQKIPNWSETIKGLWDADCRQKQQFHVILLGSAPLLMQQGLSESLAGRIETIHLMHWSFSEMAEAFKFDIDQFIYYGGYPGGANMITEEKRWGEYILNALIEPNIEKDILKMQRVDKPALLKKLFYLGTEYSGQILSYTKMLGQLHDAGNTTTLARYLDLLSKAGLLTGIEEYSSKPYKRKASSPKLNVLNTALKSAGSEYSFNEAKADRSYWGRLVESAVGAHLLNSKNYRTQIYYWRENNFEVDFVLKMGPKLIAIEVKSGTHKPNLSGLKQFKDRFHPKGSFIVGEGGIPLSEFFMATGEEILDME